MVSLILRVVAFILFLVAGFNQTLFHQGELDLIAFGLAAWVLATLLGGYGPASPWPGRRPAE
jgi:hypothetical protein